MCGSGRRHSPGLVAAADYRIELGVAGPDAADSATLVEDRAALDSGAPKEVDSASIAAGHSTPAASPTAASIAAGATALLRAPRLPRRRAKGGGIVEYDLRPLLLDVGVVDVGPPVVIRTRTRLHPSLGSGRPEEVVAALADQVGIPLVAVWVVRERIALADDLA